MVFWTSIDVVGDALSTVRAAASSADGDVAAVFMRVVEGFLDTAGLRAGRVRTEIAAVVGSLEGHKDIGLVRLGH